MAIIINDFSSSKMSVWLDSGRYRKVLIRFRHGMGDAVMFRDCVLPAILRHYPDISFSVEAHRGQQYFFGEVSHNVSDYDIVFELSFPDRCFQFDGRDCLTKPELCLQEEIGLAPDGEHYRDFGVTNSHASFVGLHLMSTCCRDLNCPEDFARQLWDMLEDSGLLPIDTYLPGPNADARNIIYPFETRNLASVKYPSIPLLESVIRNCRGFVSVSSGNLFLAMENIAPERILFLQTVFRPVKLTRLPVQCVSPHEPDFRVIRKWIDAVRKPL